jgi:hypothetical protein
MRRRFGAGLLAVAAALLVAAAPVAAHGDHDARPLARDREAGPYRVSLWQVYPEAGSTLTPHLIVMLDGLAALPAGVGIEASAAGVPLEIHPSATTPNAWESVEGLAEGAAVVVSLSDGGGSWALDPVVVPSAATSMLPMQELIYVSIALTAGTAWWAATRTARAWRRPVATPA